MHFDMCCGDGSRGSLNTHGAPLKDADVDERSRSQYPEIRRVTEVNQHYADGGEFHCDRQHGVDHVSEQQLVPANALLRGFAHSAGPVVQMEPQWQSHQVLEQLSANVAAHALFRLPVCERTQLGQQSREVLTAYVQKHQHGRCGKHWARRGETVDQELECDWRQCRHQGAGCNEAQRNEQSALGEGVCDRPQQLQGFTQRAQIADNPLRHCGCRPGV